MKLTKFAHIAQRSDHPNYKHCAIVMKGGNILSTGYNKGKKHAEIAALEKLWPDKRKGTTIISLRFTNHGLSNSMPCKNCRKYLQDNKVTKVQYVERSRYDLAVYVITLAL